MENTADLQRRFNNTKARLTEQFAERLISPPTDKDVWGQMRALAARNRDEAIADDMPHFVADYDERIEAIDKELMKLD